MFQSAILRLHDSLAKIQPESVPQFFGLAATQIRRTLLDLARHHFGKERSGTRHHSDSGGLVGGAEDVGEPRLVEEWTAFHQAVERLPEEEREIINLLWYEGLSQLEAAAVLDVNERTIRRRWRSAMGMLRRMLLDER